MSKRLPIPRLQAVGLDGRPLAGAKLYTYLTGTNTPKATWSDAALSILNANPLTADAAGRFGPIFVGPGDYRIVLEDSAGTVISTDDPVEGSSSVAGTTLTGPLTLAYANPFLVLNKAAAGQANTIEGDTNGVTRWRIIPGNATAETGANAGSDLDIEAHNDAGAFLSRPVRIARSSGDVTLGGNATISKANPALAINKAASGEAAAIFGQTGGLLRWQVLLGNTTAESGANAGSNFDVARYADAGTLIDVPLSINRATGVATFSTLPAFTAGGRIAVVDRAYAEYTTNAAITSVIPYDDTIPQVGEGTQILSAAITPKTTTNRVRVRVSLQVSANNAGVITTAAVFLNGAANAITARSVTSVSTDDAVNLTLEYEHVPGSTSAQTYTVRVGQQAANTIRLNGTSAARRLGGVQPATLILEEITP